MVKKDMHTIFLSPHFDDIALSCGGLAWQKSDAGEAVSIWTICAGDIPPGPLSAFAEKLHARWQTGREAVAQRRLEDAASCRVLGASYRWLAVPDCIYRRDPSPGAQAPEHLYGEESLMGPIHPAEEELIRQLAAQLKQELPEDAQVISPLALGGHVDHRLTRAVAERLGRELLYYADYPYCLHTEKELEQMRASGWRAVHIPVSRQALEAWQQSVAAHASQISSFWPDLNAMRRAIRDYKTNQEGIVLWQAPAPVLPTQA